MTEIYLITSEHPLWNETISLAEKCSWQAGPFLAKKMENHEFNEWERVCTVCVNGKVAGFCSFAERDELPEKYTFTPFIGFVFVDEPYRGNRLSELMIQKIIPYAYGLGYEEIYVMSGETGLYEKYGFLKLGDYETIYGSIDQLFVKPLQKAGCDSLRKIKSPIGNIKGNLGIQEVTANDAEFLFQLMNEPSVMKALNEVPTKRSDWEEAVPAWRADADEKGYIIFNDATPIGWFAVNGLLAKDHSAFLKMAALLPAYQGRHIGRYVLTKIMEGLKSTGIASITLFTNQNNIRAQKCYSECGFQIVDDLTEEMSDHTIASRYKMECKL